MLKWIEAAYFIDTPERMCSNTFPEQAEKERPPPHTHTHPKMANKEKKARQDFVATCFINTQPLCSNMFY